MILKNKLTLLFLVVFLFSCENQFPGYKKIDEGIYMKLVSFDDNVKSIPYSINHNYVSASIMIKDEGELKYTRDKAYLFYPHNTGFAEMFNFLNIGDSAVFMVSKPKIKKNPFNIHLTEESDNDYLEWSIKIHSYFSEEEYQTYLKENDFEMTEQVLLNRYLKDNGIDKSLFNNGIYKLQENLGDGEEIKKGKQIQIRYIGTFMNNIEFDRTIENQYLEFNYGTPNQVIRGLDIALKGMKKGEKSKIIIPSHLAYGEEGSNTGIVPPFTTLIYKLEIINVK